MAENNFENTEIGIQTPVEETCDQVELKSKAVPAAPRNSYAGYSNNELSNDEVSKLKRIQSFDERKNEKRIANVEVVLFVSWVQRVQVRKYISTWNPYDS